MSSDMKKALKKAQEAKKEKKITERASKISAEERQRKREEYELKRATANIERKKAFEKPLEESLQNRESYIANEKKRYQWLMELAKKGVFIDFDEDSLFTDLAVFLFRRDMITPFLEEMGLLAPSNIKIGSSKAMQQTHRSFNKPLTSIDKMDFLSSDNATLSLLYFIRDNQLARKYENKENVEDVEGYIKEENDRMAFLSAFRDVDSKEKRTSLINSFVDDNNNRVDCVNLGKILRKYKALDAFLESVKGVSITDTTNIVMMMVDFIVANLSTEFAEYNKDLEEPIDLDQIKNDQEKRMRNVSKDKKESISDLIDKEKESLRKIQEHFLSDYEKKMVDALANRGNTPPFDYEKEYLKEETERLAFLKAFRDAEKDAKKVLIDEFVYDPRSKDIQAYRVDFVNLSKILKKYKALETFLEDVKDITIETSLVMMMVDFITSNLSKEFEAYNQNASEPINLREIKKEEQKRLDRVIKKTRKAVSTELAKKWDDDFGYVDSDKLREFVAIKGEHAPPKDDTIMYTTIVRDCLKDYHHKPWIYGYNGKMYVRVLEGDVFKGYFLPEKVEWKSQTFQRVTPSFDLLLCNALNKRQEGNVLSLKSKDREYKIELLYGVDAEDLSYDFLQQDQDLYEEEQKWIHSQQVASANYLGKFLWSPLKMYEDRIRRDIRDRIEGVHKENGVTSQNFQRVDAVKIEKMIYDQLHKESKWFVTVKAYLERVAYLLIFLDDNYMKKDAVTFINRLENSYYNAEAIANLTVEDIFPEIYEKGDQESIDYLNKKIDNEVKSYVMIEGRTMEALIHHRPFSISIRPLRMGTVYSHTEMLTKNDCVNKEDVMNERTWDIVYYKEDDLIYCFKLLNLVEQFSKGDYINPKTGNEFDEDFIAKIETTYQIPKKDEKVEKEVKVNINKNPLLEAFFEVERGMSEKDKDYYDKVFNGNGNGKKNVPVKENGLEQFNYNVNFDIPGSQHQILSQIDELKHLIENEQNKERKEWHKSRIESLQKLYDDLEKKRTYTHGNVSESKREKMRSLLLNAIHSEEIASRIEEAMFNKYELEAYTNKYYELIEFLREPTVRDKLLRGEIQPEQIVEMSEEELMTDEQRKTRAEIQKWVEGITRSDNVLIKGTPTTEYRCSKCGQRNCVYYEKQTRSADEPMTIFIMCVNCGHKWRQ